MRLHQRSSYPAASHSSSTKPGAVSVKNIVNPDPIRSQVRSSQPDVYLVEPHGSRRWQRKAIEDNRGVSTSYLWAEETNPGILLAGILIKHGVGEPETVGIPNG